MTHMVIVHMATDKSYHPCEDLASAVSTMERFRNEDGVESLDLFQMSPVNFEFKTYYQVEIDGEQSSIAAPATLSAVAPLASAEASPSMPSNTDAPVETAVMPEAVEASGLSAVEDVAAEAPVESVAAVEMPMATEPSTMAFPAAAAADEPFTTGLVPPPPPAPAIPVPAPAAAVDSTSMFGQSFEPDPFLAAAPAAPVEVPAGSGLGFELSPQTEPVASPFGDVPQSDPFGSDDLPPPPAPPSDDILSEMAEIADKAKEPRRGLFGR